MSVKKRPNFGKHRFPCNTKFPPLAEVAKEIQKRGLDIVADEKGQESSKELTDWYVSRFCSSNNLTTTTL